MASTVTELLMRRMGAKSGSAIDWESIARGMLDCTTEFSVPSDIPVNPVGYLFTGHPNLKAVILANATNIGVQAFDGCSGLTAIEIPSGYTQISSYGFRGCTGLTTITIPSTISTVAYRCFQNCTNLVEAIFERTTPPTLQEPFYNCTALTAIYVPDASVEAYKAATSWASYASIIKPISQRPT